MTAVALPILDEILALQGSHRYTFTRTEIELRDVLGMLFALIFAILLGTASIFSRRGLATGSFYALLVISLAIGTPIFLLITALTTGFANTPVTGVLYAAAGAIFGSVLGRSLYILGINYLGPGKSLSISATSPLYAAILAWVILDEALTVPVILGTVIIVTGIITLSKDIRTETERADYSLRVALYPLLGAIFAAISVTLRKLALTAGIEPLEAATVNMVVGLLIVTPLLLGTRWRTTIRDIDRSALWNFAIASTIMALGFIFYFIGLKTTNASIFFPIVQTQPLFAVLLSAIFLRQLEIITRWTILGSLIIVTGATLVVIG